eukprot:3518743-Pleurochrysis_carterae.AAC.5
MPCVRACAPCMRACMLACSLAHAHARAHARTCAYILRACVDMCVRACVCVCGRVRVLWVWVCGYISRTSSRAYTSAYAAVHACAQIDFGWCAKVECCSRFVSPIFWSRLWARTFNLFSCATLTLRLRMCFEDDHFVPITQATEFGQDLLGYKSQWERAPGAPHNPAYAAPPRGRRDFTALADPPTPLPYSEEVSLPNPNLNLNSHPNPHPKPP